MTTEITKTNGTVIQNPLLTNFEALMNEGIAIPPDAPEVVLDNYTRLTEGENRFRLVSKPIYGAEVWYKREKVDEETGEVMTYDNGDTIIEAHVVRFAPGMPLITPSELADFRREKPRRFIAAIVFNYKTNRIECLTASNRNLFESLMGILKASDDSMNPFKCDIKITKKFDRKAKINGSPMDIYKYIVTQTREKDDIPPDVEFALLNLPIQPDLQLLFEAKDPFEQTFEDYEEVLPTPTTAQLTGTQATNEAKQKMKKS